MDTLQLVAHNDDPNSIVDWPDDLDQQLADENLDINISNSFNGMSERQNIVDSQSIISEGEGNYEN